MHYEYAVEPEAIGSSWENFRYLIEKFGFDKGRLISRFPKKWEKQVIEAAKEANIGDVAHKRIVERLSKVKNNGLIRSGRDYKSQDDDWLTNAIVAHGDKPFHAIIAQHVDKNCDCIIPLEDADNNALLSVSISQEVPRTSVDLANAFTPILCAAREILIIDPYFDLRTINGNDCSGPLRIMLRNIHNAGKENVVIQIHYRAHDTRPPIQIIEQQARTWVDGVIPEGFLLELYEWQERPNGEDFHDRYLICDCGGLMIGAGFSAQGSNQSALITLLDNTVARTLKAKFSPSTTAFDLVMPILQIAANGAVTRR